MNNLSSEGSEFNRGSVRDGELRVVLGCARCGQDHYNLPMYRFERSLTLIDEDFTHWATCPLTGDPILVRRVDENNAIEQDQLVVMIADSPAGRIELDFNVLPTELPIGNELFERAAAYFVRVFKQVQDDLNRQALERRAEDRQEWE